ncbi:MAG: transaldolase [Cellulomonadaceae bacterium]|jgi:transaldolase|nr:transaldolase [Cellulomonadaceae bacterium]
MSSEDGATCPTKQLSEAGVSIWLDDLSRNRLTSGNLAALIKDKDVVGVTTNQTIFAAALAGSDAYQGELAELAKMGVDAEAAVEKLTTEDVRAAAKVLRGVYDATDGGDGFVSIEVDPRLSRDTKGTIAMAHRLYETIAEPNVMIKIPATLEGLPAITSVLGAGISVNVTLIFSIARYKQVMDAFIAGISLAHDNGHDISKIASVASFFISRVDAAIDPMLVEHPELQGKAAVANAVLAYEAYRNVFENPANARWAELKALGARAQRPLWASTGVKNPAYPDTLYVTDLVAPGVVNTMPEATLNAVADHGVVTGDTVTSEAGAAAATMRDLAAAGVDFNKVTADLEAEGLSKFEVSWAELLDTVKKGLASA